MINTLGKIVGCNGLGEAANVLSCGVPGNRIVVVQFGAVCSMLAKLEGL